MLYVHMAVILNEYFFPQTDPHTASLMAAFAFCSTFVLRPFGALIFGYIGDNIGRKATVILTTMMMSTSCIIMANLPTYAQIGITATWVVTLCRIIQGLSSMGEIMGAEIYVTETIKPPAQYPAVSFIILASSLGSTAALAISSLITKSGLNWRVAFWVGAGIAVVGSIARTRLRETPEFLEAKERKHQAMKTRQEAPQAHAPAPKALTKEKGHSKAHLAYILVQCGWPMAFYFGYLYFNPILKDSFGYSSSDIIFHNFLLSLIVIVSDIAFAILSYHVNPLTILRLKGRFFIFFTAAFPFLVTLSSQVWHIFLLQAIILSIPLSPTPADAIFIRHFPVLKRFTTISFIYALSRALMYIINSFGVVYLTESFGNWGAWAIMLPVTLGFLWGVNHFEKLEHKKEEKQRPAESSLLEAS